ncbi:hypothetical protein AFX80_02748 [Listeria monocytogenes]|nr:hypothetical protein DYZ76_02434 [Listeria monocytogenes]RKB22876.1 hypothetical protein AFX80_02748 [Listeria monocytogenes]CWU87510.1 Uncharacterised protein [Listeria monocytogenes]CWW01811.1 Uncharacterised protein [Listeria monocytogenes]
MKAYVVGLYSDSDAGQEIVFAETANFVQNVRGKLAYWRKKENDY